MQTLIDRKADKVIDTNPEPASQVKVLCCSVVSKNQRALSIQSDPYQPVILLYVRLRDSLCIIRSLLLLSVDKLLFSIECFCHGGAI